MIALKATATISLLNLTGHASLIGEKLKSLFVGDASSVITFKNSVMETWISNSKLEASIIADKVISVILSNVSFITRGIFKSCYYNSPEPII